MGCRAGWGGNLSIPDARPSRGYLDTVRHMARDRFGDLFFLRFQAQSARNRQVSARLEVHALLLCGVATNAARGFLPLDLGKQPHRENHEKAEERDDILDAIMS